MIKTLRKRVIRGDDGRMLRLLLHSRAERPRLLAPLEDVLAQAPLVLRERLDRDLRQPFPAHLLHRSAHRPDPMCVASAA